MKYGIELGYVSKLSLAETYDLIDKFYSEIFVLLKNKWDLKFIHSPLITEKNKWLNDDFNNSYRPIDFDIPSLKIFGEVLQRDNKWRRESIMKGGFNEVNKGILTNSKSIRRDVEVDNITSVVYDEIGIELFADKYEKDKNLDTLTMLYSVLYEIDMKLSNDYNELQNNHLSQQLIFISHRKLKIMYPLATFQERINLFGRENGNFVVYNHIVPLINSKYGSQIFSEDIFDFESYSTLYVYNWAIEKSVDIAYSSYQVMTEKLKEQNRMLKENWKSSTEYNYLIKSNLLPLTISIGFDVNRFLMLICEKQHIAEVHYSVWSKKFTDFCKKNNVDIF
ncbi:hypothetical protein [Spiroplasma endosymbiont of Aspidapion aeneum]|uniref:hypothetical protein n=1 Tax=Spiroplasma endosymbiont of Aspidapion aeneum TaxID=3066276 RepID=UPI00313EF2F2